VGVCYLEGSGVDQDRLAAAKYIQRAADRGLEAAKQQVRKLGIKSIKIK